MLNTFKKIIILAFLSFLLHACTENGDNKTEMLKEPHIAYKLHLLVFKANKQLEIWKLDEKGLPTLMTAYPISYVDQWPIGVFESELDEGNHVKMVYPNDFYRTKMEFLDITLSNERMKSFSLTQILSNQNLIAFNNMMNGNKVEKLFVLPNDAREEPIFHPCINCPHWTPELYASLKLHLNQYVLSK